MILILICVISAILIYTKIWKRGKSDHFLELAYKLQGPQALPLIGNGLGLKNHPLGIFGFLNENVQKFGNVTRIWVGNHLYVYLTHPEDIEIILKDTLNITKSSTYDYVRPWLGNGLITSTGQHWHAHRKEITPAFHFNILEKFVNVFSEKGKILIENLDRHLDGKSFNIVPYISLYALDAIMETSMGLVINAQDDKDSKYVHSIERLKEIMTTRVFSPLQRQPFLFYLTEAYKEQTNIIDYVNEYSKRVMKERSEMLKNIDLDNIIQAEDDFGTKKKRLTFLDLLLMVQKGNSNFIDNDLLDEVNTFLFAGHDTTTSHISFLIYSLADNPEIQQKVYDEITSLYGNKSRILSMKDLKETKYLDMVMKEALRLYTPVPSISRKLDTDLKLKNYTIPAGTALGSFIFMMHRNPKVYPDPLVFDPERFSPENITTRSPYAFLPFSAGLRNCIGQKYAILETKLTIIELLWHYKIIKAKNLEEFDYNIVLMPKNGIHVRLEKRNV